MEAADENQTVQREPVYAQARASVADLMDVMDEMPLDTDQDLEEDDVKALFQHRPWQCTDIDMMHRALYHQATKCFTAILWPRKFEDWTYEALVSLFFTSCTYDYNSLHLMVSYVPKTFVEAIVNGRQTTTFCTPLMAATTLDPESFWQPCNIVKKIQLLQSLGAVSSSTNIVTVSRIDEKLEARSALEHIIQFIHSLSTIDTIPLQKFDSELLECVDLLLQAMKKEQGENLPVSLLAVLMLHENFSNLIRYRKAHETLYHSLEVNLKVLDMVLKAGLNLRNMQQKRPSPINPTIEYTDHCNYSGIYFDQCCEAMANLIIRFGRSGKVFDYMMEFYMKLLLYGHQPDMKWALFLDAIERFRPAALLPLVPRVLSLMSPEKQREVVNADRLQMADELDINYLKSVPIPIKFPTLQELCRRVTYMCIKDGRMATHVDKLPITKQTKAFLMFQ